MKAERGSLTLEAALILPVVLLVLIAAFEAYSIVATHQRLVAAVREGARTAATSPDPARAVASVRSTVGEALADRVVVSVRRSAVVGEPAIVEARIDLALRTPILEGLTVPVTARSVMRIER